MMQRIFAGLVCLLLLSQHIGAVVNNAPVGASETDVNASGKISSISSTNGKLADSIASASNDQEPNRREGPIVPHEVYGSPANSYVPSAPSSPGMPVPVYGVPDGPTNNVIFSNPSADILPSLSSFSTLNELYGPAKGPPHVLYEPLMKDTYGLPLKETYGPPKGIYGSLKGPYGLASHKYGPPPQILPVSFPKLQKPNFGGPIFKPKLQSYGAQLGLYGPAVHAKPVFKPKPFYGPPKAQFGLVKSTFMPPKPAYGVPLSPIKQNSAIYGSPLSPSYGPSLSTAYSPVKATYRLPDPVPHGPPHPGAPAPPTPPDVKYDGWHPMPGLVSRPPSDSYEVPNGEAHSSGDLQFNHDLVPPPAAAHGGISSLSLGSSYGNSAGISDSYGAPLNTVTGTGSIISTSGDAHIHNKEQNTISLGLSAAGIGSEHDGQLSVIKSVGYEIFPNGASAGHKYNNIGISSDSYLAPSVASASSEPYTASYPLKNIAEQGGRVHGNYGKGMSFSTSTIGLIPPNGIYGVPPSGQYGTPLLHNSYKKHIYRDPVPQSLIQSIAHHVEQIDAATSIGNSGQHLSGPAYIPSPAEAPNALTHLHSLPQPQPSAQAQLNFFGSQASTLSSYGAPLGSVVNNTYGSPQAGGVTVGIDHSHSGQIIDLTHLGSSALGNTLSYHCNAHKSQPLPQLSYGVPSVNSYTASLSSMKTNIGGGPQPQAGPDLQTAFSVAQPSSVNTIEDPERYQYSVASGLVPGGEVIKSQSIDLNNIPLQGQLGSYTLKIQPANGVGGTGPSSDQVPHNQVLNDGLLQSILAAIEQPQQKGANSAAILADQQAQVQISNDFQLPSEQAPIAFVKSQDVAVLGNVREPDVLMTPSTMNAPIQALMAPTQGTKPAEDNHQLIDDNEMALYFSNNLQAAQESAVVAEEVKSEKVAQSAEETVKTSRSGSYVNYQASAATYEMQ